jgi:hypothetical protein
MSPWRAWRKAKGYNLRQAGEALGISTSLSWLLDQGHYVSLPTALRVEKVTGIPHRLLVRAYAAHDAK